MATREYKRKNRPSLDRIYDLLEGGRDLDALANIRDYGVRDFFADYAEWLDREYRTFAHNGEEYEDGSGWNAFSCYTRAVNLYHGQGRKARHGDYGRT